MVGAGGRLTHAPLSPLSLGLLPCLSPIYAYQAGCTCARTVGKEWVGYRRVTHDMSRKYVHVDTPAVYGVAADEGS